MALAKNTPLNSLAITPESEWDLPVKAGVHIYEGALLGLDGGYVRPVNGASYQFVGEARAEADNTAGSNGDIQVRVRQRGRWHGRTVTGDPAVTARGNAVYAGADDELKMSASSAVRVGTLIDPDGSGAENVVAFEGCLIRAMRLYPLIAAIAAFTDSTAGTAADTLAALPNPSDSPATADALRDDLVTNVLPVLRNWAASFAAKIAELRTALLTV